LNYYQQILRKLRVNNPEEVEREIARSREFSKVIKKKCGSQAPGAASQIIPIDKKLKFNELVDLEKEAL
jgi:hypothetical protein